MSWTVLTDDRGPLRPLTYQQQPLSDSYAAAAAVFKGYFFVFKGGVT